MDIIMNRRSIRKYTGEPVSDSDIKKLLAAAMRAPSARNEQPWEFVVLRQKENMLKILDFHPYANPVKEAACVIVVCGNIERQKSPHDYWIQDCSAATQNLLLEASYLGLGAVWMGVYPNEERTSGMRKLIGAPEHIVPLAAISIGHPAEAPAPVDTYEPERIYGEEWGNSLNL